MVQHPALRVVFFGTPDFAVPALRMLAEDERFDVSLVVTQPDRPSGRGQRLASPPVKVAAEELELPIYQPESLKLELDREPLRDAEADLFVVAAFGLIFGRKTLDIPRLGCINMHASILPKYRGASPVAAAIACGDHQTGISLMKMDIGLDTGPVIATSTVPIADDETTESLTTKLADLGGRLAVENLGLFAQGELEPMPQDSIGASVVRPLKKADGWLDWTWPAAKIERWVRAMWPWPRAWTTLAGEPIQIHKASVADFDVDGPPGTVISANGVLAVKAGLGVLVLDAVQLAGGKPLAGNVAAKSGKIVTVSMLGESGGPVSQPPFIVEMQGEDN
jgi:methionyl-tRNA formyltransferase